MSGRDANDNGSSKPRGMHATLLAASLACALAGCMGKPANPAATQPATSIDPESAKPEYWFNRPPTQTIVHDDFMQLWRAARRAAIADSFVIDRVDFRHGVMTTFPSVSKQFFEPWRRDAVSGYDVAESSLATVRRTVQLEFKRQGDSFECVPKVLVERYASTEHRITFVTQYRDVFSVQVPKVDPNQEQAYVAPADYWYAIRRDANLEKQLADSIRHDLRSK